MFFDQLTQLFDFFGDQGFKIENIAFAEEGAEGFTAPSMDIVTGRRAYATGNSQGP